MTIDGQDHKAEGGQEPVAGAITTHLFVEARRQWDIFSQAPTAPPNQQPTTATGTPTPGQPAAGTTTPAHIPDRPPKTFAAWTQQVTAFEGRLLDGKRRTFPLNPLAADRAAKSAGSKALRLEHGALVPEEPSEWSPKGLLSTIDGANAARWAWILLGIGEEDDVMRYVDWFVAKARAHAEMVPAIQAFWHKMAWTIAMALRNSTSFGEAAKTVMNDVATWQEVIITHAAPPRRPPALPPADPGNAAAEDYDDPGANTWGGGNRRKRHRPGKLKGKGRDGKDQDPPKKTDAAYQQDQIWWSTAAANSSSTSSSRPGGATAVPTNVTNTPTGTTGLGSDRAPARAPVAARDSTGPRRRATPTPRYPTSRRRNSDLFHRGFPRAPRS